jgi:hypothetical protein
MNKHVSDLFDEIADLTDGARSRYFAGRHVSDDTRVQVEGLLAFDCETRSVRASNRTIAQAMPMAVQTMLKY